MLLEAGANVNSYEIFGRSPLWKAVSEDGRLKKAELLLEHGANPNQFDIQGDWAPLQAAIRHAKEDRLNYVQLLLKHGASVNHRDRDNRSSLHNLILVSSLNPNPDAHNDLLSIGDLLPQ
jgi:ankyrin repeat protein